MANAKKRCRYCKEYKEAETMLKVPLGVFCDFSHASKYGIEKSQAKRTKEVKRDIRQKKETLLTARDWIKKAQAAVNSYVRLRDEGKACISCGSYPEQKAGGTIDAGHYRSRGAAGHLRFNLFNIHSQCVKCNRYNSGNAVDYRIRLIEKIGVDRVEKLECDNAPKSFTIDYLSRLQKIFLKRSRHLKKLRGNT